MSNTSSPVSCDRKRNRSGCSDLLGRWMDISDTWNTNTTSGRISVCSRCSVPSEERSPLMLLYPIIKDKEEPNRKENAGRWIGDAALSSRCCNNCRAPSVAKSKKFLPVSTFCTCRAESGGAFRVHMSSSVVDLMVPNLMRFNDKAE